jgi:chorismate dehydratase
VDLVPRELGERAAAGELTAGLLPLADYLRLQERFERLGRFGIAVRGRARSVVLFSRRPIRQLDGATIAVTQETSTTAVLLRLILEQRYRINPAEYRRGTDPEADALLLIGDEALRVQQANTQYPYEIDLAFEWWLWQHLPFVFAIWAIRKDADPDAKKSLERSLSLTLGRNTAQLPGIAEERSASLGIPAAELAAYLSRFVYRLSADEEQSIARFTELVHEHHLL